MLKRISLLAAMLIAGSAAEAQQADLTKTETWRSIQRNTAMDNIADLLAANAKLQQDLAETQKKLADIQAKPPQPDPPAQ